MNIENNIQTEDKIILAAKKVFQTQGYFGARMQEIADVAGINKAMLHYYFRTKEKLFNYILTDAIKNIFSKLSEILESESTFEEKVKKMVDNYVDLLMENNFLPGFIISELNRNSERLINLMNETVLINFDAFIESINKEIEAGKIRKIDPRQLIVSIIGLCIFPFAAKSLFEKKFDFNSDSYNEFLIERKEFLINFILNGIKKYE